MTIEKLIRFELHEVHRDLLKSISSDLLANYPAAHRCFKIDRPDLLSACLESFKLVQSMILLSGYRKSLIDASDFSQLLKLLQLIRDEMTVKMSFDYPVFYECLENSINNVMSVLSDFQCD